MGVGSVLVPEYIRLCGESGKGVGTGGLFGGERGGEYEYIPIE